MEIVTLLIMYVLGLLTGAVGMVALTLHIGRRALNKKSKEAGLDGKKIESITSRMKRVKEITTEQMDLQGGISGPQKNALHGKHKNGLMGRLKELEEQKNDILKSIITDGFDPEISVMDESGVVTNIKLSEFLVQTGIKMEPKGHTPPPPTKQMGKFTVHKGGKDDGGETTH